MALVTIALLSLITLAGYRAVSSAAEIAITLEENARAERAFFSAESESAFRFLTSPPVERGILTGMAPSVETDGFSQDNTINIDDLDATDLWRADGQARLSTAQSPPVTVIYYDAAGFPPITALPERETTTLLAAAGFEPQAAALYAARIGDFQDDDSRRRFRGAEAADYRLYSASPPTNSPLRTSSELASVLGFADAASADKWGFFVENVGFGGFTSQFIPTLGPPAIADLFANASLGSFDTDPLINTTDRAVQPTGTARFLLDYRLQSGLTRRRAVEIMRTAAASDRPFRRIWIYDKAEYDQGTSTPASEQRDLAAVFQAADDPDSR